MQRPCWVPLRSIRAQEYFSCGHARTDEGESLKPQMPGGTGKSPPNSPAAKFTHNVVPASRSLPFFFHQLQNNSTVGYEMK